ncbi:stage V sporulation protein AC [Alteribacillus persepolensis]|uniref:Stage V sporulation protein AC n=1 Tax=Alteribacillus persepolensis TaxID=568899 RepID=A0A1G7ZNX7_9BACI|nr:stage V sporulation protein AC [Alteribacillus persepolensis]SDH09790.1 stage V sporulation protein AC [Alteribacillus persepolensis]
MGQSSQEDIQKTYQQFASKDEPKRPVIMNCIKAFIIGGLICVIGQAIQNFYLYNFDFNEQTASDPTVATVILIAVLLTGFGVYDKFAQYAGAGTAVPVTGFANAMASAAIEHRTEGPVFGIGSNMFKLAGPVIVFGTTAAFIVALVKTIIIQLGG